VLNNILFFNGIFDDYSKKETSLQLHRNIDVRNTVVSEVSSFVGYPVSKHDKYKIEKF